MSWLKNISGQLFEDALSLSPDALAGDNAMAVAVKSGVELRRYALVSLAIAGLLGCERFVEALRGPTRRRYCPKSVFRLARGRLG